MLATLNAAGVATRNVFAEDTPRNWAVGGYKLSTLKSSFDAFMLEHAGKASATGDKFVFFINVGANDVSGVIVEATWKTNYHYIIDAILTEYPTGKIYITKPWRRGYAASCNTLAGWIDDVVALYSGNVLVGDDERVWLENGDDGATMTTDGIHYSTAGQTEKAAQMKTVLGY